MWSIITRDSGTSHEEWLKTFKYQPWPTCRIAQLRSCLKAVWENAGSAVMLLPQCFDPTWQRHSLQSTRVNSLYHPEFLFAWVDSMFTSPHTKDSRAIHALAALIWTWIFGWQRFQNYFKGMVTTSFILGVFVSLWILLLVTSNKPL